MKKLLTYSATAFIALCIGFSGCSKDEDGESEKGKIEEMTDHAADVIVEKMRTPVKQARSARDKEEERLREVDEALNE